MSTILKCENLCKKFGKKQILNNVSLEINQGDILGFIGPNGAGKTTTIKLILGLQGITSGRVTINGYDVEKQFTKAIEKVGAIVENPDMYMYLTGRDNLKLVSNLYKGITKERIDEVVKLVKLQNRIDDKVSKYSLGMRQRLGIAQAILHKPNLLILDEPTNGLDPEGIKEMRELLVELAQKENMAILISSHNLAELDNFCNKVCIIKNGSVIETSDIQKIKQADNLDIKVFEVDNTKEIEKILLTNSDNRDTPFHLENNSKDEKLLAPNIEIISSTKFKVHAQKENIPEIVKELVENDIKIYEIEKEEKSLEDAFFEKTGGNVIG